jgi:superfamily II DNA or RNA helicase
VLAATTAFGKTILAIRMMAERGRNTLVLVHRRQLMDQWIERLTAFTNMPRDAIGRIGGGRRKPTGQVDVALIQNLARKGEVDDIVGNYGHLVVDECHHLSAVSFELVARRSKARYVLGLSATVTRKTDITQSSLCNVVPSAIAWMHVLRQASASRRYCSHFKFCELAWLSAAKASRRGAVLREHFGTAVHYRARLKQAKIIK